MQGKRVAVLCRVLLGRNGKALDSYSGCVRFESLQWQSLMWLKFLVVFLVSPENATIVHLPLLCKSFPICSSRIISLLDGI
jgi:hypothetical protein